MPIRAVLFDLGDTLLYFDPMDEGELAAREADALRPFLESLGFSDLTRLVELRPRIIELERIAHEASVQTLRQSLARDHLDNALRDLGLELTNAQLDEALRAWWRGFRALGGVLYPDTLETLAELRRRGFKMAILNNGSMGIDFWRQELDEVGILQYVEAVFSSADSIWRKPHRHLFDKGLEALSARPEEAIMIGDAVELDVAGANALGITSVWKRNGRALPPAPDAHYTIDTLSELFDLPPLRV